MKVRGYETGLPFVDHPVTYLHNLVVFSQAFAIDNEATNM